MILLHVINKYGLYERRFKRYFTAAGGSAFQKNYVYGFRGSLSNDLSQGYMLCMEVNSTQSLLFKKYLVEFSCNSKPEFQLL